jgi:3-dehydroquinate synthase
LATSPDLPPPVTCRGYVSQVPTPCWRKGCLDRRKTGINHPKGKNLIGAFHQPAAVVIDTATLDTLPDRELNAGMAEVIKYGAIMDLALFDWLERNSTPVKNREADAVQYFIRRAVENKSEIVSADEKEAGIRAILNFGHSFGHALETLTGYCQFLHGEAVAMAW